MTRKEQAFTATDAATSKRRDAEGQDSHIEFLQLPLNVGVGVPLIEWDPERYGSLHHPGDDYSYDIFTQAARVLRNPGSVDPLSGLKAVRLIGDGESQSAGRMVTYVDAVQPVGIGGMGGFSGSRQPDTNLVRTWEVAGTSHADKYLINYGAAGYEDGGEPVNGCDVGRG